VNRAVSRTAVAAILAGVLYFAGQAGELVFGSPSDYVDAVFVGLVSAGFVALGVALWGLRDLIAGTRVGRVGIWLALAGVGLLGLFAIQVVVELARAGELPENFVLFALGFLLVTVGQLLFARDLRPTVGRAWVLPLVAVAGLAVALTVTTDPIHDIGLFVFEASWAALGVALLRVARRQPRSGRASTRPDNQIAEPVRVGRSGMRQARRPPSRCRPLRGWKPTASVEPVPVCQARGRGCAELDLANRLLLNA
jgi:hypothetical protein